MGREEGLLTQAPGTFLGEVRERQHAPEGQAGTKGGGQRQEVVSDAPGLVAPFLPPSSFQDVSSNELQSLPAELCSLPSLRDRSRQCSSRTVALKLSRNQNPLESLLDPPSPRANGLAGLEWGYETFHFISSQ